jgi:hypothetical protein
MTDFRREQRLIASLYLNYLEEAVEKWEQIRVIRPKSLQLLAYN